MGLGVRERNGSQKTEISRRRHRLCRATEVGGQLSTNSPATKPEKEEFVGLGVCEYSILISIYQLNQFLIEGENAVAVNFFVRIQQCINKIDFSVGVRLKRHSENSGIVNHNRVKGD